MVQIGRPQNVRTANLTQTDYQAYLLDRLKTYKYRPRAPIHDMMTAPNNLFRTFTDTTDVLLNKIMQNVYQYGRRHWTWEATTSGDSSKAFDEGVQQAVEQLPEGRTGRGLLDGKISGCACGGFAAALRGLAAQIFNIRTEPANVDGSTAIFGDFITMPGTQVIDSNWKGNVWQDANTADVTLNRQTNVVLGAFEFRNHYFLNFQNTIYDVTGNRTFANTNAIIWCRLTRDDQLLPNYPGARSVYTTNEVTRSVHPLRRYLVWINGEPALQNGFSNWLMTDREAIPAADMQRMQPWSSRQ